MSRTLAAPVPPVPPLPRHPHRFRLARAGIHQVWQYDETFEFGGGRLLLRGKNGAGKSKAMEMLLPFLLDGDPRRIDATASGRTMLRWLMLDGWTGGTNRLGYLWLEFTRTDEEGRADRLTVGAAIKASASTGEAKPVYFVTPRSATDDLRLPDPTRRPSLDQLRELVRPENCYERAVEYRARVAHDLFGITDLGRYRNLTHLLHGLRRPTIGDRIEAGELTKVLTEALPPLDDEIVDEVARNLDDLDTVRGELARLERTDAALTAFLRSYRGYLRGVLRGRIDLVRRELARLRACRKAAGDAERVLGQRRAEEERADAVVRRLESERDRAAAELRAVQSSAAYRALDNLRDRRRAVEAMADAARAGWRAADLARTAERTAAQRLGEQAEDIAAELGELRAGNRDARRRAREGGVDEALLGDPPAATAVTVAAAGTEPLTDPDGAVVRVERPSASSLDASAESALAGWREQLGASARLARARQRAADALAGKLAELARAQSHADACARDAERLEGQLGRAREREAERAGALVRAGGNYADQVRRWADGLSTVSDVDTAPLRVLVAVPAQTDGPVEQHAADRDLPQAVREGAHALVDPVLLDLDGERDQALARHNALDAELAAATVEKRRWERQADPEPPPARYATAERDPRTGAPAYLLVDFAETTDRSVRANLEAALQASGLLDGWVCADGAVLAAGTRDVILRPAAPVPGPTLADVLRPAPPDNCPVSVQTVRRLLGGVGVGESEAPNWVTPDGRWRLGVAHGAYSKPRPEYVGAGARADTRARRVAELADLIATLTADLDRVRAAVARVEQRRDALRRNLRDLPDGRELTAAWAAHDEAVVAAGRLAGELDEARRQAGQARTSAARLRERVAAEATADGLPAEPARLHTLRTALTQLRQSLDTLEQGAARILGRLARHRRGHTDWERARADRVGAEQEYGTAHAGWKSAYHELRTLEESVGASEQEILAGERASQQRVRAADAALPGAVAAKLAAHDDVVRAESAQTAAMTALADQEQATVETSTRLRRPLGLPGLALAAELGDVDAVLDAFDAARDRGIRERIAALRTLADTVETRLGPASADVSDSLILRRGEELRDGLSGGYDASIDEADGVKRFALHDDVGTHDVAIVGERIRAAAEEARQQLSTREQDVFERYLLGELGDHLAGQVLAAGNLVDAMNEILDQVRSSHGIGARLSWKVPADADADVRTAVTLLRQPWAMRTREQSDQLRAALRRRIEQQRRSDPSAGYALHLRTALDYRSWFAFSVRVTDAAHPQRERVLSRRTALSQGEQRVVSYVVLFAAAAAHFTSIGRTTPTAPRLILLDDAFAKVDEPTHAKLLGLLVDLDLDFICTSERLWGCFPTVPSLHIYECLRDPAVRGVATVHYTWNGRRKRLVGM